MDRTAALLRTARELTRQIYASLPLGYRLADTFIRLSLDLSVDAFGRAIYAEFLRSGVRGMPDIHGKPAGEFNAKSPRAISMLPPGYGSDFAVRAHKLLYSMGFTPDRVDDVMSKFTLDFLTNFKKNLREGASLHEAEKFVLNKLEWEAKNARRNLNKLRGRETPDTVEEEGEEVARDFTDPNAFKELEHELAPHQLQAIFKYLAEKIHPDIPKYLELSAQGFDDLEIGGDPKQNLPGMLPHLKVTPQAFWHMKRKIVPAVTEFLRAHPI